MEAVQQVTKKSWKQKAVERSKKNHRLQQEVKRQKARAEKWRTDYYALKSQTSLKRVKRHTYPLELMWLAVWMHIAFNISLRGVSQSLSKVGELYGLTLGHISPSTIRNWCLKLGLYVLKQPLKQGDYVLILDESVEIGKEHLLLQLAVPISQQSPLEALSLQDVKVLDLSVQTSWKADQIQQRLEQCKQQHPIHLVYAISDQGSTLRKALKMSGITGVSDCTHVIANCTKAMFKEDEKFHLFIQQLNQLRAKWILSKYNFYVPPSLRSKSRFHQLFSVYRWGRMILTHWSSIPEEAREVLQFVPAHIDLIDLLEQLHNLIEAFCQLFKNKGIQPKSVEEWQQIVEQYQSMPGGISSQVQQFIQCMTNYLEEQQAKFEHQDQILCCSDIIESMFGKYKNKGGVKMITDDVLMIAAYTEQPKLDDVKRAMEQITIKQIQKWKADNTIVSKLALLKQLKQSKTAA